MKVSVIISIRFGQIDMFGKVIIIIIIIIIYHDFLPSPKRGSHIKSDSTHIIINIHPLAHILHIYALIFSSCGLFTVYPKRIM